jgi:hypothetical protein
MSWPPYTELASRDAPFAPARRTPTPRSWAARMRKRRAPTGVGKSASLYGGSASRSLHVDW